MKTALLIPTYRTSTNAYSMIFNAFLLANDDCHVFVGDNSQNDEKHRFLKELCKNPAFHLTIHQKAIGAFENWYNLLEQTKNFQFIHFLADDDTVVQNFLEPSIKILKDRQDASAAAGQLLTLLNTSQISVEKEVLDDPEPSIRIDSWFSPNIWNLHSYSLIRRSVFDHWVNYTKYHPFKAAFFDFLLTITLVCQGSVIRHSQGAYIWNAGHWADPNDNLNSKLSYYPQSLSAKGFGIFFDLHMAIECFIYVTGLSSPIANINARPQVGEIIWNRIIPRFRASVLANENVYIQSCQGSVECLEIIRSFFHSNQSPTKQQALSFCGIISLHDQTIGGNYRQHIESVLNN